MVFIIQWQKDEHEMNQQMNESMVMREIVRAWKRMFAGWVIRVCVCMCCHCRKPFCPWALNRYSFNLMNIATTVRMVLHAPTIYLHIRCSLYNVQYVHARNKTNEKKHERKPEIRLNIDQTKPQNIGEFTCVAILSIVGYITNVRTNVCTTSMHVMVCAVESTHKLT